MKTPRQKAAFTGAAGKCTPSLLALASQTTRCTFRVSMEGVDIVLGNGLKLQVGVWKVSL